MNLSAITATQLVSATKGKTLDRIAHNLGLERRSTMPRWLRWLSTWFHFWPFVESDERLRQRVKQQMIDLHN